MCSGWSAGTPLLATRPLETNRMFQPPQSGQVVLLRLMRWQLSQRVRWRAGSHHCRSSSKGKEAAHAVKSQGFTLAPRKGGCRR